MMKTVVKSMRSTPVTIRNDSRSTAELSHVYLVAGYLSARRKVKEKEIAARSEDIRELEGAQT